MNTAAPAWGSGSVVSALSNTTIPQVWGAALSDMGRGTDSQVAHMTPGEMAIPPEIFEMNPLLKAAVHSAFAKAGVNPGEFTVGSPHQKINPITGQPEFGFFSSIFNVIKKVAPVVLGYAIGGPAGAAIGGGLGSAARGGNLGQIIQGAGYGFGAGSVFSALSSAAGAFAGAPAIGTIGPQAGGWGSALSSLSGSASAALSSPITGILKAVGPTLLAGAASAPAPAPRPQTFGGIPGSTPLIPLNPIGSPAATPGADVGTPVAGTKGAGPLPGSPGIAGALPAGVSLLQSVKDRNTGQVDYTESPFSSSLSSSRLGNWGGSLLQV